MSTSGWGLWGGRLARALSIRALLLSLVVGVCAGVVVSLIWSSVAIMWVVWPVAAVTYLLAVFNDVQMVKCDQCRKRVKMGADACHHCGYSRA